MLRKVVSFAFTALLLAPVVASAGGIPAKTLKELKAASVYIKLQSMPPSGMGKPIPVTGSGFLVHVAGETGYIATNNHVVSPIAGDVADNPKVVFYSGTPDEQVVEGQVVARDPFRDLAVVKVRGVKKLPRPLSADPSVEPLETMPVYAIGFPFGANLALGKSNPAVTITKGTISSLRTDDRGDIKLVQIDAEINPGNSGGPVVDEKGQLIGVAVSKVMQARTIGFAVPLKQLAEMMQGKVAQLIFDTLWVVKDQAEVFVDAGLMDPLGKLKDPALIYRAVADVKDLPQPDKDGTTPILKNAKRLWLKQSGNKAVGRFALQGAGQSRMKIAYQTSYVTASGKTVVSPASLAEIDFTQAVYSDRLGREDIVGAASKPAKLFPQRMLAGRHYVVEMRADPKDLDPYLGVHDAAGKLLSQDDGSGGLFDALLVFNPPKDDDYHIVATATRGMGPFVLRIREDTGRELGAKGLNLPATLSASDPLHRLAQQPHQAFNLILHKGKSYAVDVKSKDFDPFVRLENMANAQLKNEDRGGGGQSTLLYSPFRDGIYRIVVTAYDGKTGTFELAVRETPGPKQYELGKDALKIAGILDRLDPADIVNGRASNARSKVYAVKMRAGQKCQIDLTSVQFDPFLRIEDMRGKQLAADDDSGGNLNARLIFTAPADAVYRLVVTQFDNRLGAFEMVVRPLP